MIPVGTTLRLSTIPKATVVLIALNVYFHIGVNFDSFPLFIPEYIVTSEESAIYFVSMFSTFFHADFYHLFGNMLFLWIFGSYVEDKIGSKKFLFYYFVCEIGAKLLHTIIDGPFVIGASGAISGIMAIYLVRCQYSKIKTLVPVLIWFIKININAVWLILFWILRDFYNAFFIEDNIANWAHIGGYVTGIIIGTVNNYWTEAKVEHLYERAIESMRIKSGVAYAEKDFLEIINIDPDNADAHLQLARYYAGHSQKKNKGKTHYLSAARIYLQKNNFKSMAGDIFTEYLAIYNEPQEPVTHLKYADTLSNVFNYSGAAKILEPVIQKRLLQGIIGEKILLSYIAFCLKANLKDPAQDALALYKEVYPDSTTAKRAMSLIRSFRPTARNKIQIEKAIKSRRCTRVPEYINDITSDPVFWTIALFFISLFQSIIIFPLLCLAFLMTLPIRKIAASSGSLYGGRYKSEEEGLRDYNITTFLDKARACERNENYEDAIEYLNAVLMEDKKGEHHIAVRYQLARLYHKKIGQPQKAIQEYRIIFKTTPKDHPYRRDAYEGIKELSPQSHAMVPGYT